MMALRALMAQNLLHARSKRYTGEDGLSTHFRRQEGDHQSGPTTSFWFGVTDALQVETVTEGATNLTLASPISTFMPGVCSDWVLLAAQPGGPPVSFVGWA